jgi:hypothetical protein
MRRLALVLTLALVSACASMPKLDAANDVHAFLLAVRDGDRVAFDRYVDRAALKTQLRSRALAEGPALIAADPRLGALGALLSGPLVDAAVDTLVQPEVFRAVAIQHGYQPGQSIPGPMLIARALTQMDDGRVCIADKGKCQLVFADEAGTWRLVAYEGDAKTLISRR